MTWELTPELSDYICDQLAEGRSLINICKDDKVPSYATIGRWRLTNPEFDASIARAREIQADYYLDRQIEYAEMATSEDYQLRKFQADNLKWVASKMKPKKYGDSSQIVVANKDGEEFKTKASLTVAFVSSNDTTT